MPQIEGTSRHQMQIFALEQAIAADNPVRVIDAFVSTLSLEKLGFLIKGEGDEGRPAYAAEMLLRLYLYGYLNRIRSSRQLEKACRRNIELWWLLNYQHPSYKVIADFRKDNARALRGVFRQLNQLCLDMDLFGRELVAVDGSKFRAQNSNQPSPGFGWQRKNNYNAAKVERHMKYIDKKLEEYFEAADKLDEEEQGEEQAEAWEALSGRVEELLERRGKYEDLEKQLEQSEERQISTTDKDARALPLHMGIVEVGYNIQTATDDKHCLIADYEVTNEKDDYALAKMGRRAKSALSVKELEVLADKGYHTGEELKNCSEEGITTYVAPKEANHNKKEEAYQKRQFTYDTETDTYTCPKGEVLETNGQWYTKNKGKGRRPYRIKRYQLPYKICSACPVKEQCVGKGLLKQRHGRAIERSEYEGYVEANAERVKANKEKYRRRQAIVEHPFGTIKRGWGYSYTLLKGKEKVSGEFALIFTSYNLRRVLTIIGVKALLERLERLFFGFLQLRAARVRLSALKNGWLYNTPGCSRAA